MSNPREKKCKRNRKSRNSNRKTRMSNRKTGNIKNK